MNSYNPTDVGYDLDQIDMSIDKLISHPVFLTEAFNIRTKSGDTVPMSLTGLSSVSTFPKMYRYLKLRLDLEDSEVIYSSPFEDSVEHQEQLESVIASLSDAQFNALVKILACSPPPRHRMYLGICAMLPRDLEALQESQAKQISSPPANDFIHPHIPYGPDTADEVLGAHDRSSNPRFLAFSISDIDGARDTLLKIIIYLKRVGFGMNPSNIDVLQRFARLSEIISRKLTLNWVSRWPMIWQRVDFFTLDLTMAYGPDGVFLPTREMLKMLNGCRNATPASFKIVAPSKELEEMFYEACGVDRSTEEHESRSNPYTIAGQ